MTLRQSAPWLLLAGTAVIYLAFPTRNYYWDGIAFAQAIEDASGFNPSLVHPNHLIYNFAGYLFYKLLRAFGAEPRTLTALQIMNSLLSVVCAGVLFLILSKTLRSLYLSVCLTALFAFSATWWKFSTDANAYIPSVLFLLISFYLVLPDQKARPLLLALTFSLSMAFHELAVLMLPVLALGVYLQGVPTSLKHRALNAVRFSVVAVLLIVVAYAYLFFLASHVFDVPRLIRWAASYSADADTQFHVCSNLRYSLRGHARLLFGGRFNLLKGLMNPLIGFLLVCFVCAVGFLIFELLKRLASTRRVRVLQEFHLEIRQKTILLLSLLWTFVYVVFLVFWLPQNTFYRLFYLPALILLFGLGLSSLRVRHERRPKLAAFVIAVTLANFLFLIYPFAHVEKYPPLAFALELNREWHGGTVIYYAAENSDKALVRYFNPATQWKLLPSGSKEIPDHELTEIYRKGGTVWLETTAIDDARWLHRRDGESRELNDGGHKIRFLKVQPGDR